MNLNRRGFLSLLGVGAAVAIAPKVPMPVAAAASAIQPTCQKYLLELWGQSIFPIYRLDGSPSQDHIYYVASTMDGGKSFRVATKPVDMRPLWDAANSGDISGIVEPFKSNPDFQLPSMPYHKAFPKPVLPPTRLGGKLRVA